MPEPLDAETGMPRKEIEARFMATNDNINGQLKPIASDIAEVKEALKAVATIVTQQAVHNTEISTLKEAQLQQSKRMNTHGERIRKLEEAAPITKQTNKWVDRAIVAVCMAVIVGILRFVIAEPVQVVKQADQPQTTIRAH